MVLLLPPFPQVYQYMLLMYYYSICTKSGIGKYISCILYLVCTTRENNLKTFFSFMNQNIKKKKSIFWAIWRALRGFLIIRLGLSCFPAILSPISMFMSNKEAI